MEEKNVLEKMKKRLKCNSNRLIRRRERDGDDGHGETDLAAACSPFR